MIFIPILLIAIIAYVGGKRILASLIFFFFLTDGFQIIPLGLFETGMGFSKSLDFAILYVFVLFVYGLFRYKNFLPKNNLTKLIFIFVLFLLISICVNKYVYGIPTKEIIRTSRYFFFVLAYFIFRRLTKRELDLIVRILFFICLGQCFLYVCQSVIGIPLLTGAEGEKGRFGTINRFYNIPIMYYYFIFYSLFNNPLRHKYKMVSILILFLVVIVSMHRSLIVPVFLLPFFGIYLIKGRLTSVIKYALVGAICVIPFLGFLSDRFSKNTSSDINNVFEGSFLTFENEGFSEGTFTFRMALFYERYNYMINGSYYYKLFGVGFMTEDSPITDARFDFKIGLMDDNRRVSQLDTSDIAWAIFILRLGFLGTFIYLLIYIYLATFFFKRRKEDLPSVISLLYILLLLMVSIASSLVFYTWMIIFPLIDFARLNQPKCENVTSE